MSKKFLEKVADEVLALGKDKMLETVVVFPNRRPKVFLKKYLKSKADGSMWLPEMLSIDELINGLSDYAVQDPLLTWFELYTIHRELEPDDFRDPADFINWAPIMLNDFNEADRALVDIEKLFTYLTQVKAMERWHLDGSPLTEFEKKYIRFYTFLKDYYNLLKQRLNAKGLCTAGMQYREVAENIARKNELPWKQFVFAGFNAMTAAEVKIVDELHKRGVALLFWDIDDYYYRPGKYGLPFQEAGLFLRKLLPKLKIDEPQWVERYLLESAKELNVVAAPKKVAQLELAGQLVHHFRQIADIEKEESLAIVLADEKLLLPLLTALPTDVTYNITMGLPLVQSTVAQMLFLWLEILVLQEQRGDKKLSAEKLISWLNNPNVAMILDDAALVVNKIKALKRYYLDSDVLAEIFGETNAGVYELLTKAPLDAKEILQHFVRLIDLLKDKIDTMENKLGKDSFNKKFPILRQQVSNLTQVIKKASVITEQIPSVNVKILQKILNRLISNVEVSLQGEPLSGVQIMGMLETRLLDFDNLIVISANEGDLPKTGTVDSFIPVDIRHEFDMPLPFEKTAIFAYHFFRLLQRVNKAYFLYNSEQASFGSSEKSRFLYQLEMEAVKVNKQLKINELYYKIDSLPELPVDEITVEKDELVLKRLKELAAKGFSASSLNQFIECPLKFYFAKVAGIKPHEELKATIEADVFGSVVHDILEKIYGQFIDREIDPGKLLASLNEVDRYFTDSLQRIYGTVDVNTGKNILLTGVIKKFVENFVRFDAGDLKKEPKELLGVEREMETQLEVKEVGEVKIYGKIDRIDRIKSSGETRIIDYKTGKVDYLSFKEWDKLIDERKFAKAFQTLLYGWLYRQVVNPPGEIKKGLYSLRNISQGFKEPKLPKDGGNCTENFERVLQEVIRRIFDVRTPFSQTSDKESCKYCDFKNICNR